MFNIIKVHIHQGDQSGFVAECAELPIVTQGQTLDEVMLNLREAINLYLDGEDLVAFGFKPDTSIVINYEIAFPLFPSNKPVVSWLKKGVPTYMLAGIVVFALWLAAPFVLHTFFADWPTSGQFGDLFGSVNALFSGLAFVALIYTIHLQRQELSLQRTELKLQREEMVASRGELAAQVAVQKSLYCATIGQIRVAAKQAHIETLNTRLAKEKTTSFEYTMCSKQIDSVISEIEAIANELENGQLYFQSIVNHFDTE